MNKFNQIIAIFLVSFLLSSCGESLIKLAPVSSLTPENFYKTDEDFENAIADLHAAYQVPFPLAWLDYLEARSDNLTFTDYTKQASSLNIWGNYTTLAIWANLYKIISKANVIISRIDKADVSGKNRVIAEARFFRGWAYFTLARMFGGVPLYDHEITVAEALTIGRASILDTYAFAEADLIAAAEGLPSKSEWGTSNYGRITRHAASGVLGSLYLMSSGATLKQDRWQAALGALSAVINSGEYQFAKTYAEVFSMEGEKGPEMVLSVPFSGVDSPSGDFSQQYVAKTLRQNNPIMLEPGTYESFEEGDRRRDFTFATTYEDATGKIVDDINLVKFIYGFDASLNRYVNDWPLLRYTDVLLMYAEALSEVSGSVQNESISILNQVRNRAGLSSYTSSDIPDMATFRKRMLAERRSEFMFEGIRWFDLVRSGTAIETLNALGTNKNANETWLLFPIPPTEIDKMPDLLPQNPGYL